MSVPGVVRALLAVPLAMGLLAACSDDDAGDGEVSVFSVEIGDCLLAPEDVQAQISDLERIPCGEPHDHEAYARVPYEAPAGGAAGDEYPGDDALKNFADGACATEFEEYVGVSYLDSSLYFTYLLPSPRSWEEDDRSVLCLVTTTGEPLTGSVEGTQQ